MMFVKRKWTLRDEADGLGDSGGGGGGSLGDTFDMSSALESISDGLGFEGTGDGDAPPPADAARTPDDSATTPAESVSAETPPADAPAPATPAAKPLDPPKTWRPEAAAKFATLPPEVQTEVLKREEDIFKGLESYKTDANFGKALQSVLQPFQPLLKQHGVDPLQLTGNLLQTHAALALGTPEQKQAVFAKLAADYGITPAAATAPGEAPFIDPAVRSLQAELNALKSQITGTQQQQREFLQRQEAEVRQKLATEIDTFAADPAHQYFDEVASDILPFLKTGLSLKDAYEKAVWSNPITRAKEQARTTAEAEANAKVEAAAKAEAARKATAANVRTRAKQASGTTPLGSIDDTLNATYAKLMAKNQ